MGKVTSSSIYGSVYVTRTLTLCLKGYELYKRTRPVPSHGIDAEKALKEATKPLPEGVRLPHSP